MIAQVREGLTELVVALWSFSVIDQLDANDEIRLLRGAKHVTKVCVAFEIPAK
jgi:hypothetical protein